MAEPWRVEQVLRTNLLTNPGASSGGPQPGAVAGSGGASAVTTDPGGWFRWTLTTLGTGTGAVGMSLQPLWPSGTPVVAGNPYSLSVIYRSSGARRAILYLQFLDSAGANIGSHTVEADLVAGAWQTLTVANRLAPANTASVRVWAFVFASTSVAGDTLDIRDLMLNVGATPHPFFTGSTPASGGDPLQGGDITYRWTGVPAASTSQAFLPTIEIKPWENLEFDLDGYRFGGPISALLQVSPESDFGGFDVTPGDVDVAGTDGVLTGRDVFGSATWTLEVFTNHHQTVDSPDATRAAMDELRALGAAWRASAKADPGVLSVLRHRYDGRVVALYGRARRFGMPRTDVLARQGKATAAAQFVVMDPLIYDDTESSLTLGLVAAGGTGVAYPITFPVVWGSAPGVRQGVVTVAGDAPVPFEVRFTGPASGTASAFYAAGPGWKVNLDAVLASDQSAVVDTRAHTVTRNDGLSLAGSARGRFLAARLSPGQQEISFGATDPTNTARATLSWRPGYHSL